LVPEINNKIILIAPLDWGLGHAARCIPLIKKYSINNKVYVGTTSKTQYFLKLELKNCDVTYIDIPSYEIKYSKFLPVWLKLLVDFKKINNVIKKENALLNELIKIYAINLIISDNRFGFYNKLVKSIIITHQLNIKAPVLSKYATHINTRFLKNFNEIWVPDTNENLLAGDLSKSTLSNDIKFIGALSRFNKIEFEQNPQKTVIILSGPEPQRTVLEKKIILKYKNQTNVSLVRGINEPMQIEAGLIEIITISNSNQLLTLLKNAKQLICRSGYSTLMDLYVCGFNLTNVTLIPTPGQTEQEYLAKLWKEKFGCETIKQEDIIE